MSRSETFEDFTQDGHPICRLQEAFGCAQRTISNIVHHRTHKRVLPAGRRRGQGSESSQTQLAGFEGPAPAQPNPNHPAPIMLPRLDGRQGPGRRPGAECPAARRWRRQRLARQVGSGVTLGRAARAQPTGETMADAMTVALKERLDRARRQRGGAARLRRMRRPIVADQRRAKNR